MTLADSIDRAVTQHGRSVTIRHAASGSGTYNSTTGQWSGPGSPVSKTVTALSTGFSESVTDGTRVLSGDRKYTFTASPAALGFDPGVGDIIEDGSEKWRIVGVPKKVRYGEDHVAYSVQARQ